MTLLGILRNDSQNIEKRPGHCVRKSQRIKISEKNLFRRELPLWNGAEQSSIMEDDRYKLKQ